MNTPKRKPSDKHKKKKSAGPAKTTAPKPIKKSGGAQNKTRANDRRTLPANDEDFSGAITTRAMSCAEQRAFVLSMLAANGQSSYFFRNNGCYQVPTRVFELRKLGHDIRTSLVTIVDADGWSHPRCAFYELGDQGQIGLDFGPAANDPVPPKKGSKK
jgi:hypothetical protein